MIINVASPIYDSVFKFLVEDEYFSAIEHRDTELMVKTQQLEENDNQLKPWGKALRKSRPCCRFPENKRRLYGFTPQMSDMK